MDSKNVFNISSIAFFYFLFKAIGRATVLVLTVAMYLITSLTTRRKK